MNSLSLSVQYAAEEEEPPPRARVRALVRAALRPADGEIGVRFVGAAESAALNGEYRRRRRPTNVLSFCYGARPVVGDIVVCCPLVAAEAKTMRLPAADHYAHLIVHGVLHLLGYKHNTAAQAARMETLERRILSRFRIAPPEGVRPPQ